MLHAVSFCNIFKTWNSFSIMLRCWYVYFQVPTLFLYLNRTWPKSKRTNTVVSRVHLANAIWRSTVNSSSPVVLLQWYRDLCSVWSVSFCVCVFMGHAIHSRPEFRPCHGSIGTNRKRYRCPKKDYCWARYSWKVPFNTSSHGGSVSSAQRRDDNKVMIINVSLAPSRRYTDGAKLMILILLITAGSRNAIFVSRYCTISTGNFAFIVAFAVKSIIFYIADIFDWRIVDNIVIFVTFWF